jgi:type IV pilus assembly protein PilM
MMPEPLPLPERKTRKVKPPAPPPPAAWPAMAVLLAGLVALGLGLVPGLAFRLGGLAPRDLQYAGLVMLAVGGLLLVRRALLMHGAQPERREELPELLTHDEPRFAVEDFPAPPPAPAMSAASPLLAPRELTPPPRPVLPPPPPALLDEPAPLPAPKKPREVRKVAAAATPGGRRPAGVLEELLTALSVFLGSTLLIGGAVYLELQWYFAGAPYRFLGFGGLGAAALLGLGIRAVRSRRRQPGDGEPRTRPPVVRPPSRPREDIDLLRDVAAAMEPPPVKHSPPVPKTKPDARLPAEPTRPTREDAADEIGAGAKAADAPAATAASWSPPAPAANRDARAAAAPLRLLRPGKVGVGLDIGAAHIKLVQVRGTRRGAAVTAFGTAPTPRLAVVEGGIARPVEVAEAVRRLMRETGVRGRRVVTVVGGPGVILRQVEFPRMSERELRETLRWEAEQHIPIPADEAINDFSILGDAPARTGDAGPPPMRVMLVGTQRKLVQGLLETMRAASLFPLAIDIDALAASRVLGANGLHPKRSDGSSVMLVDLGASVTKLSVFRDGIPAFNRTINVGGNDFTAAIAEGLGQDIVAAEATKRELGVLPDTAAARFLQPLLDDLLLEVRRSIEFYVVRHEGAEIRHICLAGGGAGLKGLPEALADYLTLALGVREEESELQVTPLQPLEGLEIHPRLGDRRRDFSPQFTVALGLALREGG